MTLTPTGQLTADLRAAQQRIRELEEENEDLRCSVIAFCAPWAVTYAQQYGLPEGHIFPEHYDILERAGARMESFARAALTQEKVK